VPGSPLDPVAALPGAAEAVDSARAAVDALLFHPTLRRKRTEVATEAALRSARASAALDGVDLDLEWLRSGAVNATHAGSTVVNGALRVAPELGTLAVVWGRAPMQALARLHVVAAAELVDDDLLGRPRDAAAGPPSDPLGLGPAPDASEVPGRLDLLVRTVAASGDVPALVVAAVVHGELMTLRPFGRADGVVARGAARLVMASRGLDPDRLTVPEAGHVAIGRREYVEALRGFASGTADGLAAWVRHCGRAVELGAAEGTAICDTLA
jgi:hypothetical protein